MSTDEPTETPRTAPTTRAGGPAKTAARPSSGSEPRGPATPAAEASLDALAEAVVQSPLGVSQQTPHAPGASPAGRRSTGPASRSGRAAAVRRRAATGQAPSEGRSAVAAMLTDHIADGLAGGPPGVRSAPPQARPLPERAGAPEPPARPIAQPAHPTPQDVALGTVVVIGESVWRMGSRGVTTASTMSRRALGLVRAVSPTDVTEQVEAHIAALAERGRAARAERTRAMGAVVDAAVGAAAASDTVRRMSVSAIEEATDGIQAVVMPAMLEAIGELETQEKLDELVAGLLLRQLPSALEQTLPGVMMRAATGPAAGLVPLLAGVLPKA